MNNRGGRQERGGGCPASTSCSPLALSSLLSPPLRPSRAPTPINQSPADHKIHLSPGTRSNPQLSPPQTALPFSSDSVPFILVISASFSHYFQSWFAFPQSS